MCHVMGPPKKSLDFHQEVGRARRDGLQSDAIVYYYGQEVSHCDDEVQLFLKTSDCQHVGTYALPDPHIFSIQLSHDCCNICSLMCSCEPDGCTDTCQDVKYMWKKPNIQLSAKTRNVSAEDKATLVEAAHELKSILNTSLPIKVPVFGLTALYGFSEKLIGDIAENCHKFFLLWKNFCLIWTSLFP